jgi:hypothetical protein
LYHIQYDYKQGKFNLLKANQTDHLRDLPESM